MFRPSLKNNWSLIGLAVLSIVLYYIAQSSYTHIQSPWFQEKLQSAQKMDIALKILKNKSIDLGYNIDKINDPNETGVVGTSISTITTSRGTLSERLITLNPNFSAAMVDILKKADLKEGDYVAVGVTGANPGANIALYCALETLKLKPVIITSVGAATYGANRELFTWLDMEKTLLNNSIISFYSEYASIGGSNDLGRGLPPEGRLNLIKAVERNNRILINGINLEDNVNLRLDAYTKLLPEGEKYKAFINLGAGVGSVGSLVNAKIITTGINKRLGEKSFNEPGAMMFFAKKNIQVIHLYNINKIISDYKLPKNSYPLPKPGTGSLFSTKINNVLVASICWIVLLGAIISVIIYDRNDRHFTSNIIDPDEEL
ncbi:MAG: poly-gamma-glutamate system protein [Candidatus Cloacimonetes bacterium]|nr:poly-gamma-glutamate system protein [Candidatus Cloacimonadota bacterium]